jgi:hypothetical protein
MGTFYINRTSYAIKEFSFEGLPQFAIDGDVTGETLIHFRMTVTENNITDLRGYLQNPQGFAGSIVDKDVEFEFQFARLDAPLPEPDYSNRSLALVFSTKREYIRKLHRPMGQPKLDPSTTFFQSVHVLSQEKDMWRRRRIDLKNAYANLDEHQAALETAEKAIALKTEALFATGTTEWVEQARRRGL